MSMSLNRIRTVSGFTLIEVMIVVAIVGILSAIAYPTYQQHVRSSRRADAQAALSELAQVMERRSTENNGYDLGAAGIVDAPADNLPFTQSPRDGTAAYNLTLTAVAANTYTLQAAPIVGGPRSVTATCNSRRPELSRGTAMTTVILPTPWRTAGGSTADAWTPIFTGVFARESLFLRTSGIPSFPSPCQGEGTKKERRDT